MACAHHLKISITELRRDRPLAGVYLWPRAALTAKSASLVGSTGLLPAAVSSLPPHILCPRRNSCAASSRPQAPAAQGRPTSMGAAVARRRQQHTHRLHLQPVARFAGAPHRSLTSRERRPALRDGAKAGSMDNCCSRRAQDLHRLVRWNLAWFHRHSDQRGRARSRRLDASP